MPHASTRMVDEAHWHVTDYSPITGIRASCKAESTFEDVVRYSLWSKLGTVPSIFPLSLVTGAVMGVVFGTDGGARWPGRAMPRKMEAESLEGSHEHAT